MHNHTPGPWEISEDGRTIESRSAGTLVNGCVVLRMKAEDARLIAAAPDLLEACMALSDTIKTGGMEELKMAYKLASAAIAKAEGQE